MIAIVKLIDKLDDQVSLDILNLWLGYMINDDDEPFALNVGRYAGSWRCLELEKKKITDLVIYGTGHDGRINRSVLDLCHIPVTCFSDSAASGSAHFMGLPVISVGMLKEQYPDYGGIRSACQIDEEGIIIKAFGKVKPKDSAKQMLKEL